MPPDVFADEDAIAPPLPPYAIYHAATCHFRAPQIHHAIAAMSLLRHYFYKKKKKEADYADIYAAPIFFAIAAATMPF